MTLLIRLTSNTPPTIVHAPSHPVLTPPPTLHNPSAEGVKEGEQLAH